MRTRDTDAIPLPARPDLGQYRKLARDLKRASRAGDADAVKRWAEAWLERLARRDHARPELDGILADARDAGLVDGRPELATLSRAQLFLARLHGFPSWPRFVRHVEDRVRPDSPIARFEAAADAVAAGDSAALRDLLRRRPELIRDRSTREHGATLLHYVAANGHEDFRQRTPPNAGRIARLLLEAGAQVDATANMYGRRCTTMEMLVSSTHPHAAGVQTELVETLLDFGAAIDGVDGDGSPLMTALCFHYPLAAGTLVRRGARVDNVIAAAALGRGDLVDDLVTADGALRPDAPLARVRWPSLPPDPAVHMQYALTWACRFGQEAAAAVLLRKGVSPAARDDDATALHHAAAFGHLEIVRLLIEQGAPLEARNRFGGTVLDGTLWYASHDPIPGVDYAAVVRALLEAGARTDVYPEMQSHIDGLLAAERGEG